MVSRILLLFSFLAAFSAFGEDLILETKSYRIELRIHDVEEGVVDGGLVDYTGVNKKTGLAIQVPGGMWWCYDPDGTPRHFHGYKFTNGSTEYRIDVDGTLVVEQGGKVLLKEEGKWR